MNYVNRNLELYAVEASQHGRPIYVSSLPAGTAHALIADKKMDVDRWSEANPDGYQRNPIPTRYRRFGRFVREQTGISPTTALLFVRNPDAVKVEDLGNNIRKVTIALEDAVIHVPDGQHRLWGIADAFEAEKETVEDFSLPITMLVAQDDDSRYEEAYQFYQINSNQKRVPTDLAQRYLLRKQEEESGRVSRDSELPMGAINKELIPYATRIVDLLRQEQNGPWTDLIGLPNGRTPAPISQNSFVQSISAVLRHTADQGWEVGRVVDTISAFWRALGELCPEAMAHWEKDDDPRYVLRTTSGVFSMNDVLAWCLGRVEFLAYPTNPETYKERFSESGLDYFADTWWAAGNQTGASGYGTSAAAFKKIRHEIVGDLARAL